MNLVEHIVEPRRLLLVWQEPKAEPERRARHIVAELLRRDDSIALQYLRDSPDFKKAEAFGFRGYPAFNPKRTLHEQGVLDAFLRRLPPRSRADFPKFLELWRLSADAPISDFALLGYSGAALPSDGFSVIHPFDDVAGPCEFLLEVAGFRYTGMSLDELSPDAPAAFEPEPTNPVDPLAVRITVADQLIGWVNRGQRETFQRWLREGWRVEASVERTNGRPERPLVYLFVKVRQARGAMRAA